MPYRDSEKRRKASRDSEKRQGLTVNPEQGKLLEKVFGKELLETGLPDDLYYTLDEGASGWQEGI